MARKPKEGNIGVIDGTGTNGGITGPTLETATPAPAVSRIYEVMDAESGKVRLIDARSQAQVTAHLFREKYTMKVASARDVMREMTAGVKVEVAGEATVE